MLLRTITSAHVEHVFSELKHLLKGKRHNFKEKKI